MKTYNENEVIALILPLCMDVYGDEWIPQEDEAFIRFLKNEGLFETWEKIYGHE